MKPLTKQYREKNPIAALVEDSGGVKMYRNRYLSEHYHRTPLRYRRMTGQPPDLILSEVQRELPGIETYEQLVEALYKHGVRPVTEYDHYEYMYQKSRGEIT